MIVKGRLLTNLTCVTFVSVARERVQLPAFLRYFHCLILYWIGIPSLIKFQVNLSSIFCKRKLHLQSEKKTESEIRNASAILEISAKVKPWSPDDNLGLLNFFVPLGVKGRSFSISIVHRQRFQGLCFLGLRFRGLCFRSLRFRGLRSVVCVFELCFQTDSSET